MVELLLKKKTQVNCRLDAMRHSSLTPLHIACGSSSTNTIAIARLLLENGADVNAESLAGKNEYLSLIDPLAANINRKVNDYIFLTYLKIICYECSLIVSNTVAHRYILLVHGKQQLIH